MDQNKYYTPEPSELYEGYELESQTMKGFIKGTFPELIEQDSELDQYNQWGLYMKVAHCVLRTKYLDREDIEALGWTAENVLVEGGDEKDIFIDGYTLSRPENILPQWFVLFQLPGTNKISIEYRYYTNQVSQTCKPLFEGNCKSKNELRKIMQFIGI